MEPSHVELSWDPKSMSSGKCIEEFETGDEMARHDR
jgi:hypothetical protein